MFVRKIFSHILKPLVVLTLDKYSVQIFSLNSNFHGITQDFNVQRHQLFSNTAEEFQAGFVLLMISLGCTKISKTQTCDKDVIHLHVASECVYCVRFVMTDRRFFLVSIIFQKELVFVISQSLPLLVITPRWKRSVQQQLITRNRCTLRSFNAAVFSVATNHEIQTF